MGTVIKSLKPKEDSPPDAGAYDHLKDSMGRFRTQSLFVEMKNDSYPAPFTLKDKDHRGCVSMYRKYMEIGDPTEYSQAIAFLGSWRHWLVLSETKWFKPYITRWREELSTKFESDRFQEMINVARDQPGTPQGLQATKWLAERFSGKETPKRGRPSKEEINKRIKEDAANIAELEDDAARIGINT